MTLICLECATPKRILHKGEFSNCLVCKKDTHTIEGKERRPLCHDCANFMIKCRDDQYRPALNYGKEYLGQGHCMASDKSRIVTAVGRTIGPSVVAYTQYCDAFKEHSNAPGDGRPNPLSIQERKEWRDFLQMPQAFWLDPRRWEGINDPKKQKFWDQTHPKRGSKVGGILTAAAIVAGLLVNSKKESK